MRCKLAIPLPALTTAKTRYNLAAYTIPCAKFRDCSLTRRSPYTFVRAQTRGQQKRKKFLLFNRERRPEPSCAHREKPLRNGTRAIQRREKGSLRPQPKALLQKDAFDHGGSPIVHEARRKCIGQLPSFLLRERLSN